MPASYVDEFYDCVPGWPRAKNDESAGQVIKCRGSLNDYNHIIHASNNAFINHHHFKKKTFCSLMRQNKHTHAYEKSNQKKSSIRHAYCELID